MEVNQYLHSAAEKRGDAQRKEARMSAGMKGYSGTRTGLSDLL
jgi:hypothetical protein